MTMTATPDPTNQNTPKRRRNPGSRTIIYSPVEYVAPTALRSVVAAKTLANGLYLGVRFKVLMNHGIAPCAYVSLDGLQEIILANKAYNIESLVHGGITYQGTTLKGDYSKYGQDGRTWIGWSYAQSYDFTPLIPSNDGIKWTTEVIVAEVKKVIDSIKKVEKAVKQETK